MLPELPALQLEIDEHHRHKDVYEHSLTVLEQAIALETGRRTAPVPGPDLVLRLAALLHDIGKPATRRFEAGGGVSLPPPRGGRRQARRPSGSRRCASTRPRSRTVARLVELHLRFHGYGDGAWTDSAVRRYVTDAGPLLPRLHRLTRSDCTTRNARKAAAAVRGVRRPGGADRRGCSEQEELAAVRPDLDGNEIMAVLGHRPGPRGRARPTSTCSSCGSSAARSGPDAALAELASWWAARHG